VESRPPTRQHRRADRKQHQHNKLGCRQAASPGGDDHPVSSACAAYRGTTPYDEVPLEDLLRARHHPRCSFSNLLSIRDALNCTETGRLTGCPARVVSPSCPIFPPPHLTFVGFCAVLDRTRWHVSQFRHGDDQIPSGGSFRAVPQQHSIFDLRIARGVRYRKGPVRCVPRYADANLMYGSVHAVRQHDG
jgi:hypothetical protein